MSRLMVVVIGGQNGPEVFKLEIVYTRVYVGELLGMIICFLDFTRNKTN